MKKFFAMALTALAIVSCSKSIDENVNNPEIGEEIGSPTYATFKFNTGATSTMAAGDFDPTVSPDDDTDDAKLGNIKMLIFNAGTKMLEHNVDIASGTAQATVLLAAGRKKIFFFANIDNLPLNDSLKSNKFLVGTATTDDLYAMNFDAGVAQQSNVDIAVATRTFDTKPLYTQVLKGTAGLPMSNTNETTYTIKAGVNSDQTGGTPSTSGVSDNNTFSMQLYYMIAKANIKVATGVLNDGSTDEGKKKAIISGTKFSVRNAARQSNYLKYYPINGQPQSFYYNYVFKDSLAHTLIFDNADQIIVPFEETAATSYVYVPENNHALMTRGQSSYFAIQANYEPIVIDTVKFDVNSKVQFGYTPLATSSISVGKVNADKNYIHTLIDIQGIPAGTYFVSKEALEEAAYMMAFYEPFVEADHREEAKKLVSPTSYHQFKGAQSYYRVDLGNGNGVDTDYGVLRSNKYQATINRITGPGVPTEGDLTSNPTDPVSAKTYINATIIAASWNAVTQSADL